MKALPESMLCAFRQRYVYRLIRMLQQGRKKIDPHYKKDIFNDPVHQNNSCTDRYPPGITALHSIQIPAPPAHSISLSSGISAILSVCFFCSHMPFSRQAPQKQHSFCRNCESCIQHKGMILKALKPMPLKHQPDRSGTPAAWAVKSSQQMKQAGKSLPAAYPIHHFLNQPGQTHHAPSSLPGSHLPHRSVR